MCHDFLFMIVFSPNHRLLCCTPVDCKKNIGQFKAVEVCVSTLSVSISSLDYLVSWQNCLPFVAMATRKSISLMLWTRCLEQPWKCSLWLALNWDVSLCQHLNLSLLSRVSLSREELKLCRQNIESLLEQRDNLEKEIERQKAEDNRWVQN